MPVQGGANVEMPAQAVSGDFPVMRQIARGFTAGTIKTRQTREYLSRQMLLRPAREKPRLKRLQRAIVGNTQRRRIVLPLPAHKRMQQRSQIFRRELGQLQRVVLLFTFQG